MQLHFHSSALLLIAALSACSLSQGLAPSGTQPIAQGDVSALGEVVDVIDSRIWCILQCRNGDYWFGSNGNGVYRYDGQRVVNYSQADGLFSNQVRDIEEDSLGNVLISTNGGIVKFDGQTFCSLELVELSAPVDGWKLSSDDVWIVLDPGNYGPCRYDGERLYHLKLPEPPATGAYHAEFPESTLTVSGVYSIYKDRRGHLWFGTANTGLCRYDGQTLSWMYEERLTTTPNGGAFGIRSIYEDRSGDFWVTNTEQRFEVSPEATLQDGHSFIQYVSKEGLPGAEWNTGENFSFYPSMTEDNAGELWMACGNDGVWKYDGEAVTRYAIGDGAYALTIYRDQAGVLWVGTVEQGIYTFDGTSFEPFKLPEMRK
jgi:ligand-binding sensor domain-containing protein